LIAGLLGSKERAQARGWLRLFPCSRPIATGATEGDIRTAASENLPSRKVSVGARNSKFWQSDWKIYLKRTVARVVAGASHPVASCSLAVGRDFFVACSRERLTILRRDLVHIRRMSAIGP
jgi:hypothetical protein